MKRTYVSIFIFVLACLLIGLLLMAYFPALMHRISLTGIEEKSQSEALVNEKIQEDVSENDNAAPSEKNRESQSLTPVPVSSPFSFAIIGDTQRFDPKNTNGGFQQAVKNITAKKADFLMTEGDLLSSCGDDCAENLTVWKNILGPLVSHTYELMGNHDRTGRGSSDSAWQESFDLPTNGPSGYSELVYSFDFQNSHFIILNSEKSKSGTIDQSQRDWLENDLLSQKKENIFVFFHEPAYPVSSKIDASLDAHPEERNAVWNIFTRYGVTAVFNGHEHIHSRKKIDNVYQFVFGNTDSYNHDLPAPGMAEFSYQGKSFGIVKVDGRQITVNLYSVEGVLMNSFEFSH